MRDSSTQGIRDYAGNVQQRGATLANLMRGVEPTDAQKALFNIANPGTEQGAMDLATGFMPFGAAGIVSPKAAQSLNTLKKLPDDEIFRAAVSNTPGASIGDSGLLIPSTKK